MTGQTQVRSPKVEPLRLAAFLLPLALLGVVGTALFSNLSPAFIALQLLAAAFILATLLLGGASLRRQRVPQAPAPGAVEHSPEQLQLAIESMQVGVWDYDIVANTLHWDRRMYELVGMDTDQAEPSFDIWRRCILPREYLDSTRELGSFYQEFPIVHPDGQLKYLAGSALVLRDPEGNPIRIVGINYEITERRLAEEELEEALVRAERLAYEAELAAEAKGEFLANMSHEIRTPINGVIGLAGVLLDSELNDAQRMYAEIIRQSADTLLFLVNDILDFSKLEAEKLQLEEVVFSPHQIIEDVGDALALLAGQKRLELAAYTTKETPAFVLGDPGRLRQVLLNIVGNAVKFTDTGSVELRLSTETEPPFCLIYEIIDTGIGIAPDTIQTLFDPFVQVDGSATRSHGGTGLGLSISRRLVNMMGGEIIVESELGRGSHFSFRLPLTRQAAPPESLAGRLSPTQSALELAQSKVVVVSPVRCNQAALLVLLDELGAIVTIVTSLEEIESPAAYVFLLLDVVHQQAGAGSVDASQLSDAPQLSEVLRAVFPDHGFSPTARWASTKAIALIPFGTTISTADLQSVGLSGAITKPIKRHALLDCLVAVHQGQQAVLPADSDARRSPGALDEDEQTVHIPGRILVVDDNFTNQTVARIILEKLGHRVDTVADGNEAVRALSLVPYDLVFMDVQMPIMDGFTATKLIRQGAHGVLSPTTPIVAMTAYALAGDKDRCIEAGMDNYIAKPVSPEKINSVLGLYLAHAAKQPAHEHQPPAPDDSPIFDRASFLARVVHDETLAAEVAGVFIETTPEHIAHLRRTIEEGLSSLEVRQCAHRIKGAAGNISAMQLYQHALELEHEASEGHLARCLELLPRLEQAFTELRGTLQAEFHLPS